MSMEERQDAAASTIAHCKRMYEETANPYYVTDALYAAHWGGFTPPEWALEVLLGAVHSSMKVHHTAGKRISIDAALGLAVARGKGTPESEARRSNIEANAFHLVKTIHTCFDVSIPVACETAYYAIDFNFARSMDEVLWRPRQRQHESSSLFTPEQWSEFDSRDRERSAEIVDCCGESDAVRAKLRAYAWWSVTHADRLSYSLDRFIERYYRVGSKRQTRDTGRLSAEQFLLFEGHFLILSPERCTRNITVAAGSRAELRCVSAVETFTKREPFERFHTAFAPAGLKSIITAQ